MTEEQRAIRKELWKKSSFLYSWDSYHDVVLKAYKAGVSYKEIDNILSRMLWLQIVLLCFLVGGLMWLVN